MYNNSYFDDDIFDESYSFDDDIFDDVNTGYYESENPYTVIPYQYADIDRVDYVQNVINEATDEYFNLINGYMSESASDRVDYLESIITEACSEMLDHYSIFFGESAVEEYASDLDNDIASASYMYEGVGDVVKTIGDAVKGFIGKIISIFKKDSGQKMKTVVKEAEKLIRDNPALGKKKIKFAGKKMTVNEAIAIAKTNHNKVPGEMKDQLAEFNAKANAEPGRVSQFANQAKSGAMNIYSQHSTLIKAIALATGVGAAAFAGHKVATDPLYGPVVKKMGDDLGSTIKRFGKGVASIPGKAKAAAGGVASVPGKISNYRKDLNDTLVHNARQLQLNNAFIPGVGGVTDKTLNKADKIVKKSQDLSEAVETILS